eukprot:Platyproteum_vivax@DN5971_c0_g2_i1.p1
MNQVFGLISSNSTTLYNSSHACIVGNLWKQKMNAQVEPTGILLYLTEPAGQQRIQDAKPGDRVEHYVVLTGDGPKGEPPEVLSQQFVGAIKKEYQLLETPNVPNHFRYLKKETMCIRQNRSYENHVTMPPLLLDLLFHQLSSMNGMDRYSRGFVRLEPYFTVDVDFSTKIPAAVTTVNQFMRHIPDELHHYMLPFFARLGYKTIKFGWSPEENSIKKRQQQDIDLKVDPGTNKKNYLLYRRAVIQHKFKAYLGPVDLVFKSSKTGDEVGYCGLSEDFAWYLQKRMPPKLEAGVMQGAYRNYPIAILFEGAPDEAVGDRDEKAEGENTEGKSDAKKEKMKEKEKKER